MEFNEKLTKMRKDRGISVYQLAQISDVSENYIRKIEKGSSQPSITIMKSLLDALGIKMSEFFNEDEEVLYPTQYERNLIMAVRELDMEKADALLHMARIMRK